MTTLQAPINKDSVLPWEAEVDIELSKKTLPSLSIVIPIYNSGFFLEKTLRSLLCNDLRGVEIILIDGASTDNTGEVVERYRNIFSIVISEKDEGQSDAINKGFNLATGNILYWLNGDDILLPNTLNRVREYFLDNDCHIVVGNAYMTELDFDPIRHFVFSNEKLKFEYLLDYASNHLIQPSVFFSREAWDSCGPLDKENHYSMDADLFLSMSRQYKMEHINVDLAYSVYHESCKTRWARAESIVSLALVQAKHGGHEQAAKTMGILVQLYNECSTLGHKNSIQKINILEAKLATLKQQHSMRKLLMLKMGID